MDEFLSIDNDDNDDVTRAAQAAPVQGDMSAQADVLAQAAGPIQIDVPAQADLPPRANVPIRGDAPAQGDVPYQGDYEDVAKCTRSASARGSSRPTKKPCRSLMTELARELPSPQCSLEAAVVATDISKPIVTTQQAAFEVAPAIPEPADVIVTSKETSTILHYRS